MRKRNFINILRPFQYQVVEITYYEKEKKRLISSSHASKSMTLTYIFFGCK